MGETTHSDTRRINQLSSNIRGRDRGRYYLHGRGRGRGRGRRGSGYYSSPYSTSQGVPNFTAETRTYPSDMFHKLSIQQKAAVQQAKVDAGWKDRRTQPDGFVMNGNGYTIPSLSIISTVQSHYSLHTIRQFQQVSTPGSAVLSLPPPPRPPTTPRTTPGVPTTITTSNAGQAFGSSALRRDGSISAVSTVNGHSCNGPVYDSNENRIT